MEPPTANSISIDTTSKTKEPTKDCQENHCTTENCANHSSRTKKRSYDSEESNVQPSKLQKIDGSPELQSTPSQNDSPKSDTVHQDQNGEENNASVSTETPTPAPTPTTIPQKQVDLSSTERFNLEQLKNLTEGDPGFETELLTLYKQDLQPSLEKLTSAFNSKNQKQCILCSHDLKGASANIGADAIREIGRVMEELCKDGFLEEAESYLEQLKDEILRIHPILDQHLASLGSSS